MEAAQAVMNLEGRGRTTGHLAAVFSDSWQEYARLLAVLSPSPAVLSVAFLSAPQCPDPPHLLLAGR